MREELKEKLDNLPENYAKDIDIVALKALCTVPETEEIVAHMKGLVKKLEEKYANDDEIKNLIPKDEMTLEKLIELLEEKYATNIDFITLKAMMNLEDSKEKEKTVKIYLNKINQEDEFEKLKIKYITGEIVSPENADFSKTEGYRLSTAIEWEWFARGGKKGIDDGSFECTYAGSNSKEKVAWIFYNDIKLHDIAGKQANSLGLYDCSGNVDEWCFDTWSGGTFASYGVSSITKLIEIPDKQNFRYLRSDTSRVIRGGNGYNSFGGKYYLRPISEWATGGSEQTPSTVSLCVVRTANPKY